MENENFFQEKKISVATLIRKIVFDLNSQLIEFPNSNSLETKQRFGAYIVNTHKKIKMLLKFLSVVKNSKKLEDIQKLTEFVMRDKSVFYDMSADIFIKVSNLKLQKIPEFNISKAVSILCFNRFDILDSNILKFIVNNSIDYYSITKNDIKDIFDFEQKFSEGIKESCIDRYKTNIKLKLRSHIFLYKLQDKIHKEHLLENDYYYTYEIGNFMVFNIMYYPKDNEHFTYQIASVKINPKDTIFKTNEEQNISLLNLINIELVNKNFPLNNDYKADNIDSRDVNLRDPCEQLCEVIKVIKNILQIHILPLFFKKLQDFIEKILMKQYKKIVNIVTDNEQIVINFKFEQKFENFFIKFSKFVSENRIYIKIVVSHKVKSEENELIFIHNSKEIISFNELNETAFDLKIYEALRDFYKIQNHKIFSNLKLFQSNEFEVIYELKEERIFCYLRRNFLLFSLFIDNKGELNLIDEARNILSPVDKTNILEFVNLLNENKIDSYKQINNFYLYLYNTVMKKRFMLMPECLLTEINNEFIVSFLVFDNIFVENVNPRKKSCYLRFLIQMGESPQIIKIKKLLIISVNNQEIIYNQNEENCIINERIINISLLVSFYNASQNFKKNYHTNLQILFEILNYGKIEINSNLNTVIIRKVENILNKEELLDINEFYDRIEINLQRCLLFKIVLSNKLEKYDPAFLRSFYHHEMEYQIDYNLQKNEINLGVITKLSGKRSDFNDIRKFFTWILPKIMQIIVKTSNICKSAEFKHFLSNYGSRSIVSPLSFDIKMINGDFKKNLSIMIHLDPKDKKLIKVVNSATKSINSSCYLELIKSVFEDLGEKFVENIKNFNFYNVMIEKLFLKFSHGYQNPHIYDFILNQAVDNSLFMIPKNYKTFHFISRNNVSFILEFFELNKVKIYTTNFNGYETNSRRLIDAMLSNPPYNNAGMSNGTKNIVVRRGVIYEIESINMENDIRSLIEMIEHLSINSAN